MSLEKDIENIVKSHGAKLYDIESVKENDENIYRVYIVKDGGVDLNLCTDISRDISPLLDVTPAMSGEYRFEVSSPGIERKLTKKEHFKNSIGEKVKVKILGEGKEKGTLVSADDEKITIETKDGEKEFPYEKLGTVKTYFDW
jgi:ribosome maturation factor RimP